MRATRLFAAVAMPVVLVAAACGGGNGSSGGSGGTYTIAVANDPGNLDPLMSVLSVTQTVSKLAYDELVHQNKHGEFVPGLAKSWKVHGTTATFTLVDGVTCSDGSKLTPRAVADSLNFVSNPKNKSPLLGLILQPGAKATADGKAGTVTLRTPRPNAFLLNNLASLPIVCEAGTRDRDKLAHDTIGSGPWVLTEGVPNDHYTYKRRDGYTWGAGGAAMKGHGVPDTVVVRVISNMTTMANLVLAGKVNFAAVSGADRKRLRQAGVATHDRRYPLGETFFNQKSGRPTADVAVRKALTTALDIPQLRKVAAAGHGVPSRGMLTLKPKPCSGNTASGVLPRYDPDRARQLLDAAGWHKGAGGIRAKNGTKLHVRFIYSSGRGKAVAAGAELLAKQWKAVGVDVKLHPVTSTQLQKVIFSTGDWDAGWVPITVSTPSQLVAFVSGKEPPSGTNFARIDNDTYSGEAKTASGLTGSAACSHWHAAEKALFDDFDVVPMFDAKQPTFLRHATATMVAGNLHGASLRLVAR